jgi:hypothetical protein
MPTLKHFLATGDIRPLALSMSSDEARSAIGSYEGIYVRDDWTIEKHGQFQLQFEHGKLVTLDWMIGDHGDSGFQVTESSLKTTTTLEEFLQYCDEAEMPWVIDERLTFDRQLTIRTCGLVVVFFDLDRRKLQRISVNLR